MVGPSTWRASDAAVEPAPPSRRAARAAARARRSAGRRPLVAVLLVMLLVVGSVLQWGAHQPGGVVVALGELVNGTSGSAPAATAEPAERQAVDLPPAGFEEQTTPLGQPPQVDSNGSPYAFVSVTELADGSTRPVAWSPCRPIHYTVNAAGAPARFAADVDAVMAELSAATGLQVVNDGLTDEPLSLERQAYLPQLYGDRWAPVLVQFADAGTYPELAGDVAGMGGAVAMTRSDLDYSVYVSGGVALDTTLLTRTDVGGEPAYLPVLRHELGHVLGLDHVDDPTQLMNATISAGVTTYQAGDRAGLALLGNGPCAPAL